MKQETDNRNGVWVTPREFFEPLQKEFQLEIDAAASADNTLLPRFWSVEDSAFDHDWEGERIWCNPPYGVKGRKLGSMYSWVRLCATGKALVCVALLPARTDTTWFHDFIYRKPGVEIRFVKGRIPFSGMKGGGKFPSMVVIFQSATQNHP